MGRHPASGVYKYRGLVIGMGVGRGATTLACIKENRSETSKKFSWILRRRPRPTLGCGTKERKKERIPPLLT
jgi:hypothetical protein